MIPLRDLNPTRRRPIATLALLAAIASTYFLVQPRAAGEELRFNFERAAIPCEVLKGRPLGFTEIEATLRGSSRACLDQQAGEPAFPGKHVYFGVLLSLFLHAGLLHLAGNALFLWVFGNNIEDRLGHVPFLAFYLLGGIAATGTHIAVQPSSTVPVVGASGAIAAVMGAYLVAFPRAPVRTLFALGIFFFVQDVPAAVLLAFWFISQFFVGADSSVAWAAHVGGFVFGALVALPIRSRLRDTQPHGPRPR